MKLLISILSIALLISCSDSDENKKITGITYKAVTIDGEVLQHTTHDDVWIRATKKGKTKFALEQWTKGRKGPGYLAFGQIKSVSKKGNVKTYVVYNEYGDGTIKIILYGTDNSSTYLDSISRDYDEDRQADVRIIDTYYGDIKLGK